MKLALDLNMNQNTISRYETMEHEADYETLIRFADYFDVSIDYLIRGEEFSQKYRSWMKRSLPILKIRPFFFDFRFSIDKRPFVLYN